MGSFAYHFGIIVGSSWGPFRVIMGSLSGHHRFRVIMRSLSGSFWDSFGIVLVSFWVHFGGNVNQIWKIDKFRTSIMMIQAPRIIYFNNPCASRVTFVNVWGVQGKGRTTGMMHEVNLTGTQLSPSKLLWSPDSHGKRHVCRAVWPQIEGRLQARLRIFEPKFVSRRHGFRCAGTIVQNLLNLYKNNSHLHTYGVIGGMCTTSITEKHVPNPLSSNPAIRLIR